MRLQEERQRAHEKRIGEAMQQHVARLGEAMDRRLADQDARHQEHVRLQEERHRAHATRIGETMQQHVACLGAHVARLGAAMDRRLADQDGRHREHVRLHEGRQRAHEDRIGATLDRLGDAMRQHELQTATLMAALASTPQRDGGDGGAGAAVNPRVSAPAAAAAEAAVGPCHCCGEPGHFRSGCPMLPFPSPTRTPTNGKQWVAGADGVLDYAKIEAAIARGRQPQACRMCKQWGHGTGNCPGN